MASFNPHNSEEITPQINMVPLIDILLVLLIIFMLTANLIKEGKIDIEIPKAATGENLSSKGLAIAIDKKGEYFINGKPVQFDNIKNYLTKEVIKDKNIEIVISADKDIKYLKVIDIVDIVRDVGITKYALNIEKKGKL